MKRSLRPVVVPTLIALAGFILIPFGQASAESVIFADVALPANGVEYERTPSARIAIGDAFRLNALT